MISWVEISFLIPYVISFIITLIVGIYSWRRRRVTGGFEYALVAFSQASAIMGYVFELINPSLEGKIFWDDFQWLGLIGWYFGFLAFSFKFTGIRIKHPKRTWALLTIFPALVLILIYTNPYHGLMRKDAWLIPGEPFAAMEYDFTFVVTLFGVYGYIVLFISAILLVRKFFRSQRVYRIQAGLILVGTLIPLLSFILTLIGVRISFHRDTSPFAFAISSVLIAFALFRFRLFELVPIARDRVFMSIPDAVLVLDNQFQVIDYNPIAREIMPKLTRQTIGQSIITLFSEYSEHIDKLADIEEGQVEMVTGPDTKLRYANVRITPLHNSRGILVGRVVIIRDITDRKLAEFALQESVEKYRQLVETTPDWVWSINADGIHTFSNKAIKDLLGFDVDEIVGSSAFPLIHPDDQERIREMVQDVVKHKIGWYNIPIRWNHKDGSFRFFESTAQPIIDSDGNLIGFSGIDRDITGSYVAEQAIEKYAADLEASNKELEAFSYSVSHDLRAPLRAIDGFSRALAENKNNHLDEEERSYIQQIKYSVERMNQLIEDLLRLSRLSRQMMVYKPVDMSAMVENITVDLSHNQPHRKVETNIHAGLTAEGDERLLRIALENLLGNAWKFTTKIEKAHIEFGQTQIDGQDAFFVKDNGVGFDMAYADKLFDVFQRLHSSNEFEGTGIGLATVQRIIRRHGGRVWAESQEGQGAIFYFTLRRI